jgi:hypothetical protein
MLPSESMVKIDKLHYAELANLHSQLSLANAEIEGLREYKAERERLDAMMVAKDVHVANMLSGGQDWVARIWSPGMEPRGGWSYLSEGHEDPLSALRAAYAALTQEDA